MIRVLAALALLITVWLPSDAEAEDSSHDTHHGYHPNLVAVFAGFTGEVRRERTLSLGVEYFRRFNESFSVGALAENANGDRDFWIAAIPFAWHLGHWKLYAAPRIEHEEAHGDHYMVRLGVEYAFEVGKYEIAR